MENSEVKEGIEGIEGLGKYLPESSKKELEEIFAYGENMRAEGEKKKKEFWSNYDIESFNKLLQYKSEHIDEIMLKYKYLDKMYGLEKDKFIDEFLYDDMLYSCEKAETEISGYKYSYLDYFESCFEGDSLNFGRHDLGDEGAKIVAKCVANVGLKCGTTLNLYKSAIGAEGAEALSHIELKEGVRLNLIDNKIGAEGAKSIAKNMKLKNGVCLSLGSNEIGAEGAEALSHMELKEGVALGLYGNQIGDAGAKVIAKNMKLKENVCLNLDNNEIGDEGAKAIAENMKLKENVYLDLLTNQIGDEGAEALSHMELKEGVKLNLSGNQIGDKGVEAIMQNMQLKNGMKLALVANNGISKEMRDKLKEWEMSFYKKGISCKVEV